MEDIMKSYRRLLTGMAAVLVMADPALAVDTSKTYSSGLLVGIFLAFCALIVVVQLMPTIMLLVGFIRGLLKGSAKQAGRQGSRG
jgi:prepilin signal peptidase PulO-like enzyme (type II secretory pathway)